MPGLIPFDVLRWVSTNLGPAEKPSRPDNFAKSTIGSARTTDALARASQWLKNAPPAISGQHGQNHTFGVCCTLIHGFRLRPEEVLEIIDPWNRTCQPPWSQHDLDRKVRDAAVSTPDQSPGWMLVLPGKLTTIADLLAREFEPEEIESTPHSNILDDPASIAIRFIQVYTDESGICKYQYYGQSFYWFDDQRHEVLEKEEMDARLSWFVEQTYYEKYMDDLNDADNDAIEKVRKKKVTDSIIKMVTKFLIGKISIKSDDQSEPFWVGEPIRDWNPSEVIPFQYRLVHIPSFVSNSATWFSKKTPKFFSSYSLPYRFDYQGYDGEYPPPPVWGKFLDDLWGDDADSIRCLQEWIGYLITPSTKQQKLLMLIGPPRCGKGTILKVIKNIVGARNYEATSFQALTGEHGLEPLIGKTVAVIPDARVTHRTDVGIVVERILSITGEDDQPINPKGKRIISKRLLVRFVIGSNEIPKLTESSGAINNRAVFLRFKNSFASNPDKELENKLTREIPQILRWAIDGWKSLNERGRFIQPESALELSTEFSDLSSPIRRFIKECIDIGADYESDSKELYDVFLAHSKYNGSKFEIDTGSFLQKLRSAEPSIVIGESVVHNGDEVPWAKFIGGMKLREESAASVFHVSDDE